VGTEMPTMEEVGSVFGCLELELEGVVWRRRDANEIWLGAVTWRRWVGG